MATVMRGRPSHAERLVYHIRISAVQPTTYVQYQSKSDLVADALRRMIETGEIEPGSHLRQRDVAELLGVSPTPVREAFRRLEGEGYIVTEPHRASVVVRSENSRLYENALIRAALESLGASLAAAHVTDEAIEELVAINRELAESTDIESARAANRRFHFRIYELTDSPVLLAQLRLLWRTLGSGPHVDRPLDESVRQHEKIIDALRAKDGERAAAATSHHIVEAHRAMAP
jgi:DNA-binding GntR family transcriptional regulator